MSDLKLAIVIEAIDHFSSAFGRMGSTMQGKLAEMRLSAGSVAGALERVGSRAAGIAAGIGAGFEAKRVIDQLDMFRRLSVDAGISAERVGELKDHIFSAARASRIPVDQLTEGFHQMFALAKFGDAEKAVDALAMSIQRLGGNSGAPVGALFGALEKFSAIKGPENLIRAMALLREQVGPHAEWLSDFATVAPELLASYRAQGVTGPQAVRDIGALYATLRPLAPRPLAAGTDILQILDAVYDPRRAEILQAYGVHVLGRTPEEVNANFMTHRRRPLEEYLPELMKASQTPVLSVMIDQLLGPDLRKVLSQLNPRDLTRALQAQGDPATFGNEVRNLGGSTKSALSELYTAIDQTSDTLLTPPLHALTTVLNAFPRLTAQAVVALGGLAIAGTAAGWVRNLREAFGGAGAEAAAAAPRIASVGEAADVAGSGAPAAAAKMTAMGAAAEAASRRATVAFGAMARGAAFRGLLLGDLLWNASDQMQRDAASDAEARAKYATDPHALAAWRKARDAAKQQSFGEHAFGWLPGLGDIDWTRQLPGSGLGFRAWRWITGERDEGRQRDAKSTITIRFENAPRGMRVTRTDAAPSADVEINSGYVMGAP